MNQTANYTIGIDRGDRQHTVCVLRQSGEIEQELTVRNTREDLLGLARFKGSTAVMETGTHSPWVSRYLQQMGLKVIVANARKVRAISKSDRKNDKSEKNGTPMYVWHLQHLPITLRVSGIKRITLLWE